MDRGNSNSKPFWSKYGLREQVNVNNLTDLEFRVLDIVPERLEPKNCTSSLLKGTLLEDIYVDMPSERQPGDEKKGTFSKIGTTVCLFGCTSEGWSVCARINGFRPWTYLEVPEGLTYAQVEKYLKDTFRWMDLKCHLEKKYRLYGFVSEPGTNGRERRKFDYVRVTFPSCVERGSFRKKIQSPVTINDVSYMFDIAEGMVPDNTMFSDVTGCQPMSWVRLKTWKPAMNWCSTCQIEVVSDVSCIDILPRNDIPPFLFASWDIECTSKAREFPDANQLEDHIICIGTVFERFGKPGRIKVVQCLEQTSKEPFPDETQEIHVEWYKTEAALLKAWRNLVCIYADADIIPGYNTCRFDIPYYGTRLVVSANGLESTKNPCNYFSRLFYRFTPVKSQELTSSALGSNDLFSWNKASGRVFVDVFQQVKQDFGLKDLKTFDLDTVSKHVTGSHKIDLDKKVMFDMWASKDPLQRRRVALYCVQDCDLPLDIIQKRSYFYNLCEMAMVFYTSPTELVTKGQGVKVLNQIVLFAHKMGFVLNVVDIPGGSYEGALVIEPKPGYYNYPIAVLDFKSLYPTVMMAHNLCWSAYVLDPKDLPGLTEARITEITVDDKGTVHRWVQTKDSVIPALLKHLMDTRNEIKKAIKITQDPTEIRLLKAKEQAVKASTNSVYGFTSAGNGAKYPCPPIAHCTTAQGREMNLATQKLIKERFAGSEIIYGDTDSVMVKFAGLENSESGIKEAFRMGREAQTLVNDLFQNLKPIEIEMEKVYWPYLLFKKKRYAGNCYEQLPPVPYKREAKGIEIVRRDVVPLVADAQDLILKGLFESKNSAVAVESVQKILTDLVQGKLPLDRFRMTKSLKKEYKSKNVIQEMVRVKMELRNPGSGPKAGDRVSMVVCEGQTSDRTCDKAWDYEHVLKAGLRPDLEYYLERVRKGLKDFESLLELSGYFEDAARKLKNKRLGLQNIFSFMTPSGKVSEQPLEVVRNDVRALAANKRKIASDAKTKTMSVKKPQTLKEFQDRQDRLKTKSVQLDSCVSRETRETQDGQKLSLEDM